MSIKYFHLKVKEVVRETTDTVTISFWHPLNEMIKYESGQFLTVIPVINGQKVRRSYSMSSSPHTETALAISVKKVAGGLVSNWLNDSIKEGDFLEIMEPMGNFKVSPDARNSRTVVLIGAGSGITPLISIAKSILKVEAESRVILLYGSRDENNIIFKQQLAELVTQYGERFRLNHALSQPSSSWTGQKGRLSASSMLNLLQVVPNFSASSAEYFLCGPDELMNETKAVLATLKVPENNVHKESFYHAAVATTIEDEDSDDGSLKGQEVTVLYEGSTYIFEVAPHQTILEAALDLDIDLPYSCQAGMCTACMGKCTAGKVKLDEEDGLTKSELEKGFILTCVAHPLSKGVMIEID